MSQHILIVDDEPQFIKTLDKLLTKQKFKTSIARTGKEALKKANLNPDLILLDRSLPDINGLDVCRQIRKNPLLKLTPIIFLSALDSTDEIIDGLYIGADDYITKPFNTKELFARINSALRRKREMDISHKDFTQNLFLELFKIIQNQSITSFYQPIFQSETMDLAGLEAQSRAPINSPLNNMDLLFETALKSGWFHQLEVVCWEKAIKRWKKASSPHKLFLKCCTLCFNNECASKDCFLDKQNLKDKEITLEISSKVQISNKSVFFKRLDKIRDYNVKIVVEHFEDSNLSLHDIGNILPDYFKFNYSSFRNMKSNSLKLKILEKTNKYCQRHKIQTIANDIQNSNELSSAIMTGTNLVQGDFLCNPHHRIETFT